MSTTPQLAIYDGAKVHHGARPSDTAPVDTGFGDDAITAIHGPEALRGIEMTAAHDFSAEQKQDDLYLVCNGAVDLLARYCIRTSFDRTSL